RRPQLRRRVGARRRAPPAPGRRRRAGVLPRRAGAPRPVPRPAGAPGMSGAVFPFEAGLARRRERTAVAPAAGAGPRTTRIRPWSIAGSLAMVFLVPFDVMTLPVHLPFNSTLDRAVVGVMVLIWLGAALVAGRYAPRFVRSPLNWAVGGFL